MLSGAGGVVVGEGRRVFRAPELIPPLCYYRQTFFFFLCALLLCGLHNGQCSGEKDPEGETLITQIDSAVTFLSQGTLSLPASAQVPYS